MPALAACLAVLPAAAAATTVSRDERDRIVIDDNAAVVDQITVDGLFDEEVVVTSTNGTPITALSQCTQTSPTVVACPASLANRVEGIQANLSGGDDTIVDQSGIDVDFDGGDGNDTLTASAGTDLLRGGPGGDRLSGNNGNDTLEGGPGDDVENGGNGNDRLGGADGRAPSSTRARTPSKGATDRTCCSQPTPWPTAPSTARCDPSTRPSTSQERTSSTPGRAIATWCRSPPRTSTPRSRSADAR